MDETKKDNRRAKGFVEETKKDFNEMLENFKII